MTIHTSITMERTGRTQ